MECYCLFYSDTPLRCLLIKYLWKRLFLASVFLHHQRNFSFSPTCLSFLLLVFSKFFTLSTWYSTLRVFSHNFIPSSLAFFSSLLARWTASSPFFSYVFSTLKTIALVSLLLFYFSVSLSSPRAIALQCTSNLHLQLFVAFASIV